MFNPDYGKESHSCLFRCLTLLFSRFQQNATKVWTVLIAVATRMRFTAPLATGGNLDQKAMDLQVAHRVYPQNHLLESPDLLAKYRYILYFIKLGSSLVTI